MTLSGNPTRVVVIAEEGTVQQQISSAIDAESEFTLEDFLVDIENLGRAITELDPDIILVDSQIGGKSTLDVIDALSHQFPNSALVAILPNDDIISAHQVSLAGAQFFIIQPFTQINLLSTLRRARDLLTRRRHLISRDSSRPIEEQRKLNTFSVYSPRGGVGTTTIAANLAIAIYEETGARVLLMEGKLFFGHLDVFLNIRTRNTIADLVPHASSLDDILIKEVVYDHTSGIHVLLAPSDIEYAQGIRPQEMFNILNGLQQEFEYIIIDTGSQLSENVVTMMDSSDRILLITNPDLASLHDVTRFLMVCQTLAYPPDKTMVILNRAGRMGGIKIKDIETVLHRQNILQIPNESAANLRSLNRGIPLMIKNPRNSTSRSIRELAKSLLAASEGQRAAGKKVVPATPQEQAGLVSG
ncbi:MAG: AAA family ATPase [Chloroflexota bacterium]|nr:AAA family ATPase [Chloroflexota bacterium]